MLVQKLKGDIDYVVDDSCSITGLVVDRFGRTHWRRVNSPSSGCCARYLRHQSFDRTQNSIADSAPLEVNFFCGRFLNYR